MEDAYTAVPFLLEVPVPHAGGDVLPPRVAAHVRSAPGSPSGSGEGSGGGRANGAHPPGTPHPDSPPPYMETLHFFGVFDGHGGAEAALHCAQTLHRHIADALSAAARGEERSGGSGSDEGVAAAAVASAPPTPAAVGAAVGPHGRPLLPLAGSGDLAAAAAAAAAESDAESDAESAALYDELARGAARAGAPRPPRPPPRAPRAAPPAPAPVTPPPPPAAPAACSAASFENALTDAFTRADAEFAAADGDAASLVGTTAVVALVGSRQLYVANCGDSRAVLCRGGAAVPLTDDHKAAREDETARVEAAGGQILFWNGVRVMGVLAVSRAIGDHCLRPFVIARPEVTILGRRPDDELLLLASDGLWDVLSNAEAVTLARRCLARARARGASRASAARIAATVLTRAAVDRGSRDNVTVVVVDLSADTGDEATPSAGSGGCAPAQPPE